ncbi:hypothetical protein ABT093_35065 [Kitasatospora sp. NPDC002551]|uniref:hypothetical protein n=1 Tax=Kitasatospora sp. NPDC002551 TaxID=3154539 RepID=UPI0033270B06
MRRRRFFALGAAGAGAAVVGTGPAGAEPVDVPPGTDLLEQALFEPVAPVLLPDLPAALTRARADFRAARYDRLRATLPAIISGAQAGRTAGRVPPGLVGELFTVEATAEQCALYRVGIATALGDPDAGVQYALDLDPTRLPTKERQARYFTDTARMWDALGEDRRTYEALLAMERVAPEEVRRPSVRAVTACLVHSPARLPGLRPFAARTGALGA